MTIQSTYNGAGGYTIFNEYPDVVESGLYTKDLLKKKLVVALWRKGGRTGVLWKGTGFAWGDSRFKTGEFDCEENGGQLGNGERFGSVL